MSIYTKKGDGGETGLYSRTKDKVVRIFKDSPIIEAIGSVDEANSFLGICADCPNNNLHKRIMIIQRALFTVGGILAGAKLSISNKQIEYLENEIDSMDKELQKLSGFILPGGGFTGSHLFMARTLIRKAERKLVRLSKEEKVPASVLVYVNRLSDYVYTLARYSNLKEGIKEESWKRK